VSQSVLVVGGGPAGLSAAIAARLKGFAVTVVDPATPPIDKACGEGIPPSGVAALRKLGIPISATDGFALRGIRFYDRGVSLEGTFSSGVGLGVRRTHLHRLLVERASAVGVLLKWGTHTTLADVDSTDGWIVGADGQNS